MHLLGFHHLTAITNDAPRNVAFYTGTLGLRLVKKTVNQDDVSSYHLYYADGNGSPGTDITFFDWPSLRERRGTRSVVRTGFRVGSQSTLAWWVQRLRDANVTTADDPVERDGRATLDFEDAEGQRLSLVLDPTSAPAAPWDRGPVPVEHQLHGLGPITMSVPDLSATDRVLVDVMSMRRARAYAIGGTPVHVYEMSPPAGGVGAAAELHVSVEPDALPARHGAGGVHHVAFRTPDAEYDAWHRRLRETGVRTSGPVDRFYFRSLYFREPNGVLFEIATDGPGFTADETPDALGRRLALPPFLEPQRATIEAGLRPL